MSFRLAPRAASAVAAAVILTLFVASAPQPAWAQTPSPPDTPQAVPAQPGDVFGESTALTAKTIIYVKGSGTWDKAFDTITGSFRKLKTYLDKEGLKPAGLPMTI